MTLAELWEYAVKYDLTDRDIIFKNDKCYACIDNVLKYNSSEIYIEGECIDDDENF